jgi:hypothetical protein
MSSEWLLVACHCRAAMSSLTDARPGINPKTPRARARRRENQHFN